MRPLRPDGRYRLACGQGGVEGRGGAAVTADVGVTDGEDWVIGWPLPFYCWGRLGWAVALVSDGC